MPASRETKDRCRNIKHKFHCFYTNADQLLNKRYEFEMRVKNEDPCIIGVTEAKPKNATDKSILPGEFNISGGYQLFHNFDINDNGRGTLLYVKEDLQPKEVFFDTSFDECVFSEIRLNNSDILLVGVMYRSESGSAENNDKLTALLNEIHEKKYSQVLLMGDINYPKIDWESWHAPGENSRESKFIDCLQDNFYTQHVDKPTRWRGTDTPNVLDLIITKDENLTDLEYQSPIGKSDHCVLIFDYNCYAILQEKKMTKTLYDRADYVGLKAEIDEISWADMFHNNEDINEVWNIFITKLEELKDKYVPKRTYSRKGNKGKFPLDEETRKLITKKHALSRKAASNNTDENRRAYNKMRNKVSNIVKKMKKTFERNLAKKAKKNPKDFFKFIKSKSKVKTGVGDLHTDPGDESSPLTSDDREKAEILSNFYQSVFTIEPDGEIPLLPDKELLYDMPALEISESKIEKILKKLKPDKSPGPDGLHPRFFNELASSLSKPLCQIFMISLTTHTLPNQWKEAKISTIFKKGNKKVASNYRPVSLTSIVCKIMETIIRNHIVDHMKKK